MILSIYVDAFRYHYMTMHEVVIKDVNTYHLCDHYQCVTIEFINRIMVYVYYV